MKQKDARLRVFFAFPYIAIVALAGLAPNTFTSRCYTLPMTFDELYLQAKAVLNPRKLSESAEAGGVGAALLTASGHVYTGVCIDTACSMGFCAEHAAAAAMITAGESQVIKMVAVNWDGEILPPCGRCREFISQLHDENRNADVLVNKNTVLPLRQLLPYDWREAA